MRRESASRSDMLIVFPAFITAGCFLQRKVFITLDPFSHLTISQPMWEKKKPLLALCGSACVSLHLWWSLPEIIL